MIEYFSQHLWQFWAIVGLLCLILELTSGDFFIICFAFGSIGAIVADLCGATFMWQVIIFAVLSVLCIFFVRPSVVKHLHRKEELLSNADAIVGREGRVSEDIEANGYGRVAIDGDDWKALSVDGSAIAKGSRVRVTEINSVIITVTPIEQD